MAEPKATFDAVLAPTGYPYDRTQHAKLVALRDEFGPLLGAKRVQARTVPGGLMLVTAEAATTLYLPNDHPDAGSPRYDWTDRGDGVMYGTLTAPARASEADARTGFAAPAKVKDARIGTQVKQYLGRRSELAAKADRTSDEQAEYDRLTRFLALMAPAPASGPVAGPVPADPTHDTTPKGE